MLTVALRTLVGGWHQGPFDIPQINWNALGLAGAPFSSLLSSPPLLPSPPLSSPLLPSPLLSSPLLSSPLLSSPLLSSPLLSSPRLWRQSRAAGSLSDLEPSSLYKSCNKPGHKVSGCCFLKSSRQARAAEQSCWQSFGSSGKLTFQVLLQPCHRELGCFLKSSRQALAAEQSCWQTLGSSKLTFLILLQALPQRAWLLLGEFQAGSGSRTELLRKLLHAGPSSLYKSC